MAKKPDAELVYEGAQRFLENCLRRDLSILWPTETIWTLENLQKVRVNFVDSPIHGGTFEEKIGRQFGPLPAACWQILGDALYVYNLPSTFLTADTKYASIAELIGTHVPSLPPREDPVWSAFDQGLVRTGYRYHLKFAQLRLIFLFALEVKKESARGEMLADWRRVADTLDRLSPEGGRDMRHALLHMLYPDHFEKIISEGDRDLILAKYGELLPPDAPPDSDARLALLRPRLEALHGRPFDFYGIKDEWRSKVKDTDDPPGGGPTPISTRRFWVEKTRVKGNPDRIQGPDSLGVALWSPQRSDGGADIYRSMREIKTDDVIFHLVDNRSVTGVSLAASPADDSFTCPPGTEWAGRPGYRVALKGFQSLEPAIDRADFLESSEWRPRLERILRDHERLFFNSNFELNQGAYLTEAPRELVDLWREIYRQKGGKDIPYVNGGITRSREVQMAWIFQANPEIYDIDGAVRTLKEITWTVRNHKSEIHPGDRVYIWRSGPDAGIVAVASVLTDVEVGGPQSEEQPFYRRPDAFKEAEARVLVRLERIVDPPITRSSLQRHPTLNELAILKFPRATNFKVTPEQDKLLAGLIGGLPQLELHLSEPFTPDAIRRRAEGAGLRLPRDVYATLFAALESQKHVILTGPPGTGKTTLAHATASAAAAGERCQGFMPTTATADWTTYETIGGLKPAAGGLLSFSEGHFLEAIRGNRWLVIDELNRSNFDRAFGQLFTVLSGQAVLLPHEREKGRGRLALVPEGAPDPGDYGAIEVVRIPATWRIIATINVFDKSLLFQMSYALMRRFAFVEVASPTEDVFRSLIKTAANGDAVAEDLAARFLAVREQKDIGPAVFRDLALFMRTRNLLESDAQPQLAFDAFYAYLLPQFEGIDERAGRSLFRTVKAIVGAALAERLRQTLRAVLGLMLEEDRQDAEEDA